MERMDPDPYDDGPGKPVGDMQFVSPPSALPRACVHGALSCCSSSAAVVVQAQPGGEAASGCQVALDCAGQLDGLATGILCEHSCYTARTGKSTGISRQQEQQL